MRSPCKCFMWKHHGQLGFGSHSLLLSYLGVPYSHDMCPCTYCFPGHEHCLREAECHPDNVACPLYVDEKVAEQVRRESADSPANIHLKEASRRLPQPVDLATLTEKVNAKAARFIAESAASGKPFFMYLPFHQTHHPQFAGQSGCLILCGNSWLERHFCTRDY